MAQSRIANSFKNMIYTFGVKLISFAAAFVLRTVFIYVLGMEYVGVSGLFTSVLSVLSFAELGISTAMTYALYGPIAQEDTRKINQLMHFYKLAYRFVAGTVLAAGTVCIPFLPLIIKGVPDIHESIAVIYIFYLINTASSYLLIYKSTLLTASQKNYEISKVTIRISVVKCVIESIFLVIFRNFMLYLCIEIFLNIFQNILISRRAVKTYPAVFEKSEERLDKDEIKKLFKDIRALFLYKVSGVVLDGTDNIIVSAFLGTGYVAVLSNYNMIIKNLYNLILQVFQSTSAGVGNLAATEGAKKQHHIFNVLLFLSFWLFGFCVVELYININDFIGIWTGAAHTFPAATVIVLITDFYLTGMMSAVSYFRTSNGLFVQGKYRPLIMSLINLVLSVLFVQKIGVTGVLLGTVLSRLSTQFWFDAYLIYNHVFKETIKEYLKKMTVYTGTIVIICCICGMCSKIFDTGITVLNFGVNIVIVAVIYNAVCFLLFRKTSEFEYLKNIGYSLGKNLKKKIM